MRRPSPPSPVATTFNSPAIRRQRRGRVDTGARRCTIGGVTSPDAGDVPQAERHSGHRRRSLARLVVGTSIIAGAAACGGGDADRCARASCSDGFSIVIEGRDFATGTYSLSLNADGSLTECSLELAAGTGPLDCGPYRVSLVELQRCSGGGGYGASQSCTPTGEFQQTITGELTPAALSLVQTDPDGGELREDFVPRYDPVRPGGASCEVGCQRAALSVALD